MGFNQLLYNYHTLVVITVTLWKHVMSQCSEAHNMACSWPLIQLKNYEDILYPIGGFIPDYNETTLHQICSLFQEYKTCSQPFFMNCDQETLTEFHILDSAFSPICGHLAAEYIKQRSCFQRLQRTYKKCQERRQEQLNMQETDAKHYKLHMCTVTNEYVGCTFTVTALLCSLEAANVYFKIINESISFLLLNSGFSCTIRHPNDVIKVITTTTSTTTITTEIKTSPTKEVQPSVIQHSKNPTSSGLNLKRSLSTFLCVFIISSVLQALNV
ncbi:uncharacterized protein LOC143082693 isoform X2 [Mytilus galloprovincialis]|uniref:uncharacterized protein LOC143082693 isoform X2 n=1 Tax=Mytilus galloprovincialis TaxID=29158 RepID=UPI003F7BD640